MVYSSLGFFFILLREYCIFDLETIICTTHVTKIVRTNRVCTLKECISFDKIRWHNL